MPDTYSILIVEDDPGMTSYLKRLLRPMTLKLTTAGSGRQAIQYLSQNTVDLVLLDIGLPDMDGYQVMDHIYKKLPQTLVIVMTGDVTIESAVKALRKGAYDYLRKPFESTELLNTIENALDRIRLEREHLKAEQKLRESEEKYHQLFESESDAIVVVDVVTKRFEETNRAAQLLFGYSREEILTLNLEDVSAEPEKTRAKLEIIRKGEMEGDNVYHRFFKKKDGTVFPGELSLATFVSMGHHKIIGAIRDITERDKKEKELRQTKQQLQHILASNPAVIYSRNPAFDDATTFISNNVKTELGYDPEDFINDRHFWIDHIHPDDVQYVKDEFPELEDRGSHILEYRFRHKNGSYRWMRDELRLLFEEQGNAVEVVGSWTDITDMKQAEEALRESEQQFRDLIENSPIGISIFQNDRFVYQNPEQMKINGRSPEKNIFQDLDKIFPDDLDKVKTAYRRILKGEVSKIEVDFRLFRSVQKNVQTDMRWVWCRAIAFNYYGKDAILINALDITKAKQLEQQLLIKNKMLSLGRVAAGIAHEIRNPLTGINTYLYTIEDFCASDNLDPEEMEVIRQIITQIQVASDKIESVIKRVMDFSKPGAPKMVPTNINESLEEAIELREKIFDPFFTTKDDGSGIGLNIAQRIVADHNGSISLDSSKWAVPNLRSSFRLSEG